MQIDGIESDDGQHMVTLRSSTRNTFVSRTGGVLRITYNSFGLMPMRGFRANYIASKIDSECCEILRLKIHFNILELAISRYLGLSCRFGNLLFLWSLATDYIVCIDFVENQERINKNIKGLL